MASEWALFVDGLADIDFTDGGKKIDAAASKAINKITRDKRARAARLIRGQVNLPARYVSPGSKRLWVSEKATPSHLQGRITARGRPTSLARFIQGNARPGKSGVVVEVQPGKSRFMKRAFPIKLPQGSSGVDTKFNLGLAIRLRPGETLQNKVRVRRVEKGLYLLYGPSVDQVFRSLDGTGVANDLVPEIERDLETEFLRLLDL